LERGLAEIIGVDHTMLNRVLREERNPGPKFVAGILTNTEISFDELFGINGSADD
jgi:transcriptional regulator with XRE-family HTH domain